MNSTWLFLSISSLRVLAVTLVLKCSDVTVCLCLRLRISICAPRTARSGWSSPGTRIFLCRLPVGWALHSRSPRRSLLRAAISCPAAGSPSDLPSHPGQWTKAKLAFDKLVKCGQFNGSALILYVCDKIRSRTLLKRWNLWLLDG